MPSFPRLRHYWHKALDILFPPRCFSCNVIVGQMGGLCTQCWQKMDFSAPPYCAICCHPFPYDTGKAALCGICISTPPPYRKVHTVFHYNDKSKALIHQLKYADKTHMAPYFGQWMARVGQASLAKADMLVPVPLHRYRLLRRHFNQAALLARTVSSLSGVPLYPQLLLRTRHTPSQAGLSSRKRLANVRGVFKLHPRYATLVKDKHIVLVDDVMTTGATLTACTKALKKAGAREVTLLTLAKTVKE